MFDLLASIHEGGGRGGGGGGGMGKAERAEGG